MQTKPYDTEYEEDEIYESAGDEDFDVEEYAWDDPAPRRWTGARVMLLLLVLILIAAVIVFVLVPQVSAWFAPEPLPLRPPINA